MAYQQPMLRYFNVPWREVPILVIDTETTGLRPGIDGVVEVGIARFEGGECVATDGSLVNPGLPIPEEASAIHGITDAMVAAAPTLDQALQKLLPYTFEAQPAAYNASSDRQFIPATFSSMNWPWLDLLPIVRVIDRYERGQGRHKLASACERHGIELGSAHRAVDDAKASGELFFKLAGKMEDSHGSSFSTLGDLLFWTRQAQNQEWHRFHAYLANQDSAKAAAEEAQ